MKAYKYHIFICENERAPDDPRGSCLPKGSEKIRETFKAEIKKRGLGRISRANKSGCLDMCEFGPAVVIYPEGVWYKVATEADAMEIVDSHLVRGQVVDRLVMRKGMA